MGFSILNIIIQSSCISVAFRAYKADRIWHQEQQICSKYKHFITQIEIHLYCLDDFSQIPKAIHHNTCTFEIFHIKSIINFKK